MIDGFDPFHKLVNTTRPIKKIFFLHTTQYIVTSMLKLKSMEDLYSKATNANAQGYMSFCFNFSSLHLRSQYIRPLTKDVNNVFAGQ